MTNKQDITGRDGYIIRKALAYAITTISSLPPTWQEGSDCNDMRAILNAMAPQSKDGFLDSAVRHMSKGNDAALLHLQSAVKDEELAWREGVTEGVI